MLAKVHRSAHSKCAIMYTSESDGKELNKRRWTAGLGFRYYRIPKGFQIF